MAGSGESFDFFGDAARLDFVPRGKQFASMSHGPFHHHAKGAVLDEARKDFDGSQWRWRLPRQRSGHESADDDAAFRGCEC